MDRRMLILAPRGRDAQVIEQVLGKANVRCVVLPDARSLSQELERGAGAAVITEEALSDSDVRVLRRWLDAQPSWADFPFIMLTLPRTSQKGMVRHDLVEALGNVVLLERPINAETLTSAAASALRARDRQYDARIHWLDRENDDKQLRMALMAGNLGSWSLHPVSKALVASDRFKAHFGREANRDFTYEDLLASVHPDDREKQRAAAEATFTRQEDYKIEHRVVWPDGTIHSIQVSGRTVYGDNGRPITISGVSLDVTERRRSEDVLQHRVGEAVAESQRAQAALVQAQKMEAVGQLTGGIAHDFNNLLTAIVGNIDLISRRTDDDRIKTMAGRAKHASDRAAKLTSQLLAFSRSQKLDLRPVNIDALIGGMGDLVSRSIGPTVAVKTALGAAGRLALADANQIELALLNLAINARDAMPTGGTLTIGTTLQTSAQRGQAESFIVITVADTGFGIEPAILSKVFDPFFTTKPVGKGTGLGLSQVHGIAHQSGGSVRIESEVGKGTTIEIWLRESAELEREADAAGAVDVEITSGRGHVLVIDDDPDVRRFVVECLEILGFTVTQADHGKAGLDRLDQDHPDLMIVDFAMPGMNGAQVAAAARERQAGLPIILATGYADTGLVEGAFAQDEILRKPFLINDLSRAVRHALNLT